MNIWNKIGVFGSCVSKDLFNSHFVHNCNDFFLKWIFSAYGTILISIMQDYLLIYKKYGN